MSTITTPTPRAYGYARTSKDHERSKSCEVQEDMIRAKADSIDARWIRCRRDRGVSAIETRWSDPEKRPEFGKLMRELEPGDHLITWRLDRLDRNPLEMVKCLDWLVTRGVSLHILEHGGMQLDLDKPMGRLLVMILAGFAGYFIDQLKEATRQALRWRKEHMMAYCGQPEIGKRREYRWTTRDGKRHKQGYDLWDENECDVIREIWRRHELKGETLYAIAKDIKKRRLKRWDGTPWVPSGTASSPGSREILKRKDRHKLLGYRAKAWSSRTVRRAFWRYTAMLALGKDLQDLIPKPEHVTRAILRFREGRQRYARNGQANWLPSDIKNLPEREELQRILSGPAP